MADPLNEALAAWRDATEHVQAPRGLATAVAVAVASPPSLSEALYVVGRRFALGAAFAAAALIVVAVGSVRSLEGVAAAYALSRGP